MNHIRSLDGVRALAVIVVVLFHFGYAPFGWIGVQIFFVLSGYLITNILLHDKVLPLGAYMKRFYLRRTLRIFPLYYAFILVLLAVYLLRGRPAGLSDDWLCLFTYTKNFGRLFRPEDGSGWSQHFWSLSVEEQFYLAWPLVVYLLPRKMFSKLVVALIVVIPLTRFVASRYLLAHGYPLSYVGTFCYFATFSQLDAFAAGAAVAVFGKALSPHATRIFRVAAGATVILSLMNFSSLLRHHPDLGWMHLGWPTVPFWNHQYLWCYTVIDLATASAILCSVQREPVTTLFESRPMVHIGKISYGIYVFHIPILLFLKDHIDYSHKSAKGAAVFALYVGATLVASELSYRFFESRFLRLKDRLSSQRPEARPRAGQSSSSGIPEVATLSTARKLS